MTWLEEEILKPRFHVNSLDYLYLLLVEPWKALLALNFCFVACITLWAHQSV
ncbi:Hypothetical protein P9211_15341 [Prochlorococcus marinus str. MIT 9211]|uniref:Uncharacterized protein n=1 Tax=Prochlorococcus marinus (strain MIT 9211) TaxID=93059 RepID=A9BCA3_PROM4|nr:Hypothetical protein P9211_15341 [Prochlorococcus marinus str. MIT 9211]